MTDAHRQEHEIDPPDFADSYVLLDNQDVLVVAECCVCLKALKVCVCNWERPPDGYRAPRPFGTRYFGHTDRGPAERDR